MRSAFEDSMQQRRFRFRAQQVLALEGNSITSSSTTSSSSSSSSSSASTCYGGFWQHLAYLVDGSSLAIFSTPSSTTSSSTSSPHPAHNPCELDMEFDHPILDVCFFYHPTVRTGAGAGGAAGGAAGDDAAVSLTHPDKNLSIRVAVCLSVSSSKSEVRFLDVYSPLANLVDESIPPVPLNGYVATKILVLPAEPDVVESPPNSPFDMDEGQPRGAEPRHDINLLVGTSSGTLLFFEQLLYAGDGAATPEAEVVARSCVTCLQAVPSLDDALLVGYESGAFEVRNADLSVRFRQEVERKSPVTAFAVCVNSQRLSQLDPVQHSDLTDSVRGVQDDVHAAVWVCRGWAILPQTRRGGAQLRMFPSQHATAASMHVVYRAAQADEVRLSPSLVRHDLETDVVRCAMPVLSVPSEGRYVVALCHSPATTARSRTADAFTVVDVSLRPRGEPLVVRTALSLPRSAGADGVLLSCHVLPGSIHDAWPRVPQDVRSSPEANEYRTGAVSLRVRALRLDSVQRCSYESEQARVLRVLAEFAPEALSVKGSRLAAEQLRGVGLLARVRQVTDPIELKLKALPVRDHGLLARLYEMCARNGLASHIVHSLLQRTSASSSTVFLNQVQPVLTWLSAAIPLRQSQVHGALSSNDTSKSMQQLTKNVSALHCYRHVLTSLINADRMDETLYAKAQRLLGNCVVVLQLARVMLWIVKRGILGDFFEMLQSSDSEHNLHEYYKARRDFKARRGAELSLTEDGSYAMLFGDALFSKLDESQLPNYPPSADELARIWQTSEDALASSHARLQQRLHLVFYLLLDLERWTRAQGDESTAPMSPLRPGGFSALLEDPEPEEQAETFGDGFGLSKSVQHALRGQWLLDQHQHARAAKHPQSLRDVRKAMALLGPAELSVLHDKLAMGVTASLFLMDQHSQALRLVESMRRGSRLDLYCSAREDKVLILRVLLESERWQEALLFQRGVHAVPLYGDTRESVAGGLIGDLFRWFEQRRRMMELFRLPLSASETLKLEEFLSDNSESSDRLDLLIAFYLLQYRIFEAVQIYDAYSRSSEHRLKIDKAIIDGYRSMLPGAPQVARPMGASLRDSRRSHGARMSGQRQREAEQQRPAEVDEDGDEDMDGGDDNDSTVVVMPGMSPTPVDAVRDARESRGTLPTLRSPAAHRRRPVPSFSTTMPASTFWASPHQQRRRAPRLSQQPASPAVANASRDMDPLRVEMVGGGGCLDLEVPPSGGAVIDLRPSRDTAFDLNPPMQPVRQISTLTNSVVSVAGTSIGRRSPQPPSWRSSASSTFQPAPFGVSPVRTMSHPRDPHVLKRGRDELGSPNFDRSVSSSTQARVPPRPRLADSRRVARRPQRPSAMFQARMGGSMSPSSAASSSRRHHAGIQTPPRHSFASRRSTVTSNASQSSGAHGDEDGDVEMEEQEVSVRSGKEEAEEEEEEEEDGQGEEEEDDEEEEEQEQEDEDGDEVMGGVEEEQEEQEQDKVEEEEEEQPTRRSSRRSSKRSSKKPDSKPAPVRRSARLLAKQGDN